MLDIHLLRANPELVKKNNATRNVSADVDALLAIDEKARACLQEVETLRAERNATPAGKPSYEEKEKIRARKAELQKKETEYEALTNELRASLSALPNINLPDTPIGESEKENRVIKTVGEKPKFDFAPLPHEEIGARLNGLDIERAVKISGSRFFYLTGKLAELEHALLRYAVDFIVKKGFMLTVPPMLVKDRAMYGAGFFPAEKNEIYTVNPGEDDLYLIGTSEAPLVARYADEIIVAKELPLRFAAQTACFRREAGTYGKDQHGILRVHQFNKVEMVVFARPEESEKIHEDLLAIEEEFAQSLGLPYQVVSICSGDLGFPAAKKYDIEAWFPAQNSYREITSASNTTDFQTRRLNIHLRDGKEKKLVHTLNGTLCSDRPLLAIMENFQQADGSVRIPAPLVPLCNFDCISPA